MEIVNDTIYPHLAAFQRRESVRARKKKTDRELEEDFGRIEKKENEYIWILENLNRTK